MGDAIMMRPIGLVKGGRRTALDDNWSEVEADLELDAAQFTAKALLGLAEFSHLEVVFHFHAVPDAEIEIGARRPRGRQDWPLVGIFSQRGKGRPNRIGVTICSIIAVSGLTVRVRGLDAIDGTPILDLKPVMREFLPRSVVSQPRWAAELMQDYWRASRSGDEPDQAP